MFMSKKEYEQKERELNEKLLRKLLGSQQQNMDYESASMETEQFFSLGQDSSMGENTGFSEGTGLSGGEGCGIGAEGGSSVGQGMGQGA